MVLQWVECEVLVKMVVQGVGVGKFVVFSDLIDVYCVFCQVLVGVQQLFFQQLVGGCFIGGFFKVV